MRNTWLLLPLSLVLGLSGCSSSPEAAVAPSAMQSQSASALTPSTADPGRPPSDVAEEWLRTRLSSDTRTDASRADAQHRSIVWAVGPLAEPDPSPLRGGDADWAALAARSGRIEVAITPASEDQEPDSATTARRIMIATQTPLDASGKPFGQPKQSIYRVTLTLTSDGWRVSQFEAS